MNLRRFTLALFCFVQCSCTKDKVDQAATDDAVSRPAFGTTDIREVAAAISEVSGKKFIFHPSIEDTVTVDLSVLGDSDAVYQTFLSELQVRQYQTSVGSVHQDRVYVFPLGSQLGVSEQAAR